MRVSFRRIGHTVLAIALCAAFAMATSFLWFAVPSHDACGLNSLVTRLFHDVVPYRRRSTLTSDDYDVLRVTIRDLLEHVKRDVPPGMQPSTEWPLFWPFREDGSDIGGEIVVDAHLETSLPEYAAVNLRNCYWTGCSKDREGDLAQRLSQYDAMRGLLLNSDALSMQRAKIRDLSGVPRGDESILRWEAAHSKDPQAIAYISVNPPAIAADGVNAAVIGHILFQSHPAYFETTLSRRCDGWQVLRRDFLYSF